MKSIHLVKFGAILLAILGATLVVNVPAAEPATEDSSRCDCVLASNESLTEYQSPSKAQLTVR